MDDATQLKKQVGEAAADEIQSGMVVGLGTGTTATWMVRRVAERLKNGDLTDIIGIPTSTRTGVEARALGVPLSTLEEHPVIDLTIDGADEIDPSLNVIKGGGGALLREKIVAQASERFLIVGHGDKRVEKLGTTFKLPVEVVRFGHGSQRRFLEGISPHVTLRLTDDGPPYQTDSGNYIYDCDFGTEGIDDPFALAQMLISRAGIVEHGLFLGMTTAAMVATDSGLVQLG